MALFEFEMLPVADIEPWGEPDSPSLSWFALTLGSFRMNVGDQRLFVYSAEVQARWGLLHADAEYQIAAFARDVLQPVGAATSRMPKFFEDLARDANNLSRLRDRSASLAVAKSDLYYTAWRWYGERSVNAAYLLECPIVWFARVDDEVRVCWDNRGRLEEGTAVWSATHGELAIPLDKFVGECQDFVRRLLGQAEERLRALDAGELRARIPVDVRSLRQQHERWRSELHGYFQPYRPDVPWVEAEAALRDIAREVGVDVPASERL